MKKINILVTLLCLIVLLVVARFTLWRPHLQTNYFATDTKAQEEVKPTITALPPHEELFSHPSPDGTKKVVMRVSPQSGNTNKYTFSTMDSSGENKKDIYETTLTDEKFIIPFNTWSPDNKYLFIQKESGDALVFTRTGEPITSTEPFLDVKEIYAKPERTDKYVTTTGWASPTLLIVNTKKEDGTRGNSYWFEVPSKAVIQLWGDF